MPGSTERILGAGLLGLILLPLPAPAQDAVFDADGIIAEALDLCDALGTDPRAAAGMEGGMTGATEDGTITSGAVERERQGVTFIIGFSRIAPPEGDATAFCNVTLMAGEVVPEFALSLLGAFQKAAPGRLGPAQPYGGAIAMRPSMRTSLLIGWNGNGWSATAAVDERVATLNIQRDVWAD